MDRFWTYCLSAGLVLASLCGCHPKPQPAVAPVQNPELAAELMPNGLIFRQASQSAGERLDSILGLDSTLAKTHWEIFARDLKIGNYVKAYHHMDEAVRLRPAYYIGDRGSMRLFYLRDYEGAISDYEKAFELSGNDVLNVSWGDNTLFCLAIAHCQAGNYEDCRTWMNRYLEGWIEREQDPDFIDPYAYHFRGLSYFREDNFPAALAEFDQAIDLYERISESWYWKAWCHHHLGDSKAACEAIGNAISLMEQGYMRRDKYREFFEQVYLEEAAEAMSTICQTP